MAVIKSGATTDLLTVDPTSKAARVTLYDSAGREVSFQSKATFCASSTFTPVATPTDIVCIGGSATKTVRVLSFVITTTNTAAGSQAFVLVKRSTWDTLGTPVIPTIVPFDSNFTATANVVHYTANPTTGTLVGNMNNKRVASPVAIPATWAGIVADAGVELIPQVAMGLSVLAQPITLRGVTQQLCLNFAGAALVAGQTHAYAIVWTEE